MSITELMEAMEYWQKKGFARIMNNQGKMDFEFGDFMPQRNADTLYTERDYNRMLQELFGSRQLSPHEYLKLYDYTDTFGLPKKVVLSLVEYCIALKGRRVSVTYMDKVAQSWADEGIDTPEKAAEKLETHKAAASGVLRVLKQLGLTGRGPTQDEYSLYLKWTEDWGFTLDAVLTACAHTTSAREPSMKYLDRILERLKDQNRVTSRTISEAAAQSENVARTLKEIMHLLGEPTQKPSFEHESLYHKWTGVYGFSAEMLLLAARQPGAHSRKPFVSLDAMLTDWYNNRIMTPQDAHQHMAEQAKLDKLIAEVFTAAGIVRGINDASRKLYARWNEAWGIPHDAILLAADMSLIADNPYQYLGKLLSGWHADGVRTLVDAQNQIKKKSNNVGQNLSAKPGYYERPTENYDHLAINFFEDEGA